MSVTNLPCPVCHTVIKIEVYELLNGAAFTCESCKASISLKSDNKDDLQNAVEKLEAFKKANQANS